MPKGREEPAEPNKVFCSRQQSVAAASAFVNASVVAFSSVPPASTILCLSIMPNSQLPVKAACFARRLEIPGGFVNVAIGGLGVAKRA
jgi:hypothetical protein